MLTVAATLLLQSYYTLTLAYMLCVYPSHYCKNVFRKKW